MAWFRRRTGGRHALGAAVTSLPSGPLPAVGLVTTATAPAAPQPPLVRDRPAVMLPPRQPAGPSARAALTATLALLLPSEAVSPESSVLSEQEPAVPEPAAAGPRVQLGFRDGTSAALDPGSEQSRALALIAQSLTRRD